MSISQTSRNSERALADLIDAYKSENEEAAKKIVSENGSTMYGSKTLETIWKSTEFMFETGTSAVHIDDRFLTDINHTFLVTPGGAVETLTGPLSEAHSRERKSDVLTMRILHSLQGTPTQLSQPDFLGVISAVKAAETNSTEEVSKQAYEAALGALQSAREAQQGGGPGQPFKLDLSNMPFSMQPRSELSWWRGTDKDIDTLARWALIRVARSHAEGKSHLANAIQHFTLNEGDLSLGNLFSNTQVNRLKRRMDKLANELYDARGAENSWNPEAPIGWSLHVPLCQGGSNCTHDETEHEMAERFANTLILNHSVLPYRLDVAFSVAAKGRLLTRLELRDLVPKDLEEEYNKYSRNSLVLASCNAATTRPTAFIASGDREALAFWNELTQRRGASNETNPRMRDVPTEGYDSLLDHIRLIRQGKGVEAWESRYGRDSKAESLSESHAKHGPKGFEFWLHNSNKTVFEKIESQRLEGSLPPQAYEDWRKMQAMQTTGGLSLSEYGIKRKEMEGGIVDKYPKKQHEIYERYPSFYFGNWEPSVVSYPNRQSCPSDAFKAEAPSTYHKGCRFVRGWLVGHLPVPAHTSVMGLSPDV